MLKFYANNDHRIQLNYDDYDDEDGIGYKITIFFSEDVDPFTNVKNLNTFVRLDDYQPNLQIVCYNDFLQKLDRIYFRGRVQPGNSTMFPKLKTLVSKTFDIDEDDNIFDEFTPEQISKIKKKIRSSIEAKRDSLQKPGRLAPIPRLSSLPPFSPQSPVSPQSPFSSRSPLPPVPSRSSIPPPSSMPPLPSAKFSDGKKRRTIRRRKSKNKGKSKSRVRDGRRKSKSKGKGKGKSKGKRRSKAKRRSKK
jgi:hypothetical protein